MTSEEKIEEIEEIGETRGAGFARLSLSAWRGGLLLAP